MISNLEPQPESNASQQVSVVVNVRNSGTNAEPVSQEPAKQALLPETGNKEISSSWGLVKFFYDEIKRLPLVCRLPIFTLVLVLAIAVVLKKFEIFDKVPFPTQDSSPSINANDEFSPEVIRLARGNVPVTVEQVRDLLSRWYQAKPEVFGRSSSHNSPRIEKIAGEFTVNPQDWENQPAATQRELSSGEKLLYDEIKRSVASLDKTGLYWEYLQPGRVRSVEILEQSNLVISGNAVVVQELCLRNRSDDSVRGHEDNGKYERVIDYKLLRTDDSLKIVYIRGIESRLRSVQCY